MKQIFLALSAALLLTACGNNAATKNEGIDSTESEETGEAWVRNAFPEMYTHLKAQDPSFNAARFEETEGGTTTPTPARFFPPEELEQFRPYLVYNSDSTRAIDFVSYNYIVIKKGGQPTLEPTGPDTEVGIIDMKTDMRNRIFFSGPGTTILEAKWLDDHTVLLGGAESISNTAIRPILLRIDLNENSLQRFTYTDSLQAQLR